MKRLLSLLGVACLYSAHALAADLPVLKAPAAPILMPVWTGINFGAHVGAGRSHKKFIDNFPVFDGELDAAPGLSGALAGFQLGYNVQLNWLVLGIESDFSWSSLSKKNFSCFFFGDQICSAENQWYATLAGRAGVVFGPTLLYAKGGFAWTRDEYTNLATCSGSQPTFRAGITAACGDLFTAQETRSGWVFGGGVEYSIDRNWSLKLEYNRLDFGKKSVPFSDSGNGFFTEEIHQHTDIIKVGFNYRFNPALSPGLKSYARGGTATPGTASTAEETSSDKIVYFSSVDVARQSVLGWAGAFFSPFGGLETSGFRVMLLGGGGMYKYYAGSTGIRGTHSFGDMLAGYGFEGNNYSINLLGGLSAANHMLSAFDPTNTVQGTELGAKVRADAYVNPTERSLVYGEIEYSTAFNTFHASTKVGYDFFGNGVFFGPEASYHRDQRSDNLRFGAHLSQIKLGAIKVDISAGYSNDSIIGKGAYGRLELTRSY